MLAITLCLCVMVCESRLSALNLSPVLQGYLYLTNAHLCFFAHIPSKEVTLCFHLLIKLIPPQDQILKSGSLQKKNRTKRWTKFWFVLKNDAVLWYNSSSVSNLSRHPPTPYILLKIGPLFSSRCLEFTICHLLRTHWPKGVTTKGE